MIERITALEATHLGQPPEVVREDRPTVLAAVSFAGIGLLGALTLRLRR